MKPAHDRHQRSRTIRRTRFALIVFLAATVGPAHAIGAQAETRSDPQSPRTVAAQVAEVTRTAAAVAPANPSMELAAVLATSLPRWAVGGRVEKHRLEALAADPRIKGEQAAALAATIHLFRKGVDPALPLDRFHVMAERQKLDHSYRSLVKKLPEIRRALFVDGGPHLDRLKQGSAGDCYLLSGAGWMARFRPRRLAEMIRPLPDGRFAVRFPTGEQATVAAPTDTEILFNESMGTLSDGLWMAVLEKAVGTIEGRTNAAKAAIADPTLRVNLGGSAKADVHRWTGHAVAVFELKDPHQVRQARAALVEMERHHRMAQAVVPVTHPPGPLPMNHAYAVLGYDPATEDLTVWNPWGDTFTPKGPPGLEHGWPREHGVFTIPFRDFVHVFGWLDIEKP